MSRLGQPLREFSRDDLKLVLGLMVTEGIGTRTLQRVLTSRIVVEGGFSLLREWSREEIARELRLSHELLDRFYANESKSQDLQEALDELNVRLLVEGTTLYPQSLSRTLAGKAPPVLFAQGNLSIFQRPAVGFCGSRKASQRGLEVAGECSTELAKRGINVVAGYAHGVDLSAHRAALEAGGVTTLVLAEGIMQFRMKNMLRDVVSQDNVVILSEFLPKIPWLARNAMRRNHTICGLSSAMILVESGKNGGTFEAGRAALDMGCPLFVVDYSDPAVSALGNPHFLERGAVPLRRKKSGEPNLSQVISVVTGNREWRSGSSHPDNDLFGDR